MIAFKSVRVISFALEYLDIYWEIEPTSDDLQAYDFYVDRSEAEAGPWMPVVGPLIDRYHVRDNQVPTRSATRTLFYRIKAIERLSGKEIIAPITDRGGDPSLDAQEIIRCEYVLFREHIGVKCWLFPVKTFGQRCPQCYNKHLGKRTDDSCNTCWGTTFSGGYHYPVEFWGQKDPPEKSDQVTTSTHLQTQNSRFRLSPSPDVKPGDLIVDHQNMRWKVISTGGTFRLGVTVRQEVTVVRVPKGAIEDKIPLKIDPKTAVLVPVREFSNPQTLENERQVDLSDMIGAFGLR